MTNPPETQLNTLIPPRFLFQMAVPVRRCAKIWGKQGCKLDDTYRLPDLNKLDRETPASEPRFADVRAAWAPEGMAFEVRVEGKQQPLWCRDSRLDESDGLQVWVDTRATHTLHRATKFCSRYGFSPAGSGKGNKLPVADQLLINRARENTRPVRPRELQVFAELGNGSYRLAAFIPAVALTGYDPSQYRRIGFNYSVLDRELGLQTFSSGPTMPYDEDPSCWATLVLVD